MRKRLSTIVLIAAAIIFYAAYVYDISGNPPGFYIDEALASYNAYQLYSTGQGEFGHSFPLYFPVLKIPPPHDYLGYVDPTQIYVLASLFLVFSPSYLLPRLLSATAMFFACILLGRLAFRSSGSPAIGIITALMALVTPWLFETGRLAFGASLLPFAVVVFLTALYAAHRKGSWTLLNVAAIGASLGLVTYTYSIGRLLGPLLALGLLSFATDKTRLVNVLKAWGAYAIALIPMVIFHFRNPGALAGRFNMTVGIVDPNKAFWEIGLEFLKNYAGNVSPQKMLFVGDPNMRHHIYDAPAVFIATLALALAGIVVILIYKRKDAFWRYVLFGLLASVVPASLTRDSFHMLRLIAFPVFLILVMVPALIWLLNREGERPADSRMVLLRKGILAVAVLLAFYQTVTFQMQFRRDGPQRGIWFEDSYPRLIKTALAQESRPIYLVDGYWGQAYAHAYWYSIVNGLPESTFSHVTQGSPPPGSVVISSEDKCTNCVMIQKDDPFLLYRKGP